MEIGQLLQAVCEMSATPKKIPKPACGLLALVLVVLAIITPFLDQGATDVHIFQVVPFVIAGLAIAAFFILRNVRRRGNEA